MRLSSYIALSTVFAAAACGGETPAPQAPASTTSTATTAPAASAATTTAPAETTTAAAKPALADLIAQSCKTLGEAMNAHDSAKVAGLFADDAEWNVYGADDAHGREAIVKSLQGWLDMSKDQKSAPRRMWFKGNVAVGEIVFAGTMTGNFMGMKATGKPYGGVDLIVMTFNNDGLITNVHDYFDVPGFMAQIKGAKKAPALETLPSGPPEVHVAKNTPDEDKLTEWAKTFNETFNSADPAKGPPSMTAPDAEVTFYFLGGKVNSAKDLAKFGGESHKALPDAKWSLDGAWGVDGYLVEERTETATFKGPLGPMKPTGKAVTLHFGEVIHPTADGKVERGWAYGDLAEAAPLPAPKKEKEVAAATAPKAAAKAAPAAAPAPAAPAPAAKP
jgi:ketosteroid isomerase-like protein